MIYEILPVNNYQGNGETTTFDFDFFIENESQLKVTLYDEYGISHELKSDIDYSINELKNQNGSYVTFPLETSSYEVLKSGQKISLELILPISQETQYNNSSLLNLSALEYSLDYLTRLIQILSRKLGLCVKVSECSDLTPDELIENFNEQLLLAQNYSQIAIEKAQSAINSADVSSQNAAIAIEKAQLASSIAASLHIKTMLTNCILEAPNGVVSISDSSLLVHNGLKVLIPDGRKNNGSLNNIEYTLPSDVLFNETLDDDTYYLFLSDNGEIKICPVDDFYTGGNSAGGHSFWYDIKSNYFKIKQEDEYLNSNLCIIAKFVCKNNQITVLKKDECVELLKRADLKEIPSLIVPSNQSIKLTAVPGGVYTSPACGYVSLMAMTNGADQYVSIFSFTGVDDVYTTVEPAKMAQYASKPAVKGAIAASIPIDKGDKFQAFFNTPNAQTVLRFFYPKVSESEE